MDKDSGTFLKDIAAGWVPWEDSLDATDEVPLPPPQANKIKIKQ